MRRRILTKQQGAVAPTLPDFSGYDITRMFSLFKTNVSTINYPVELKDGSITGLVFFDANGEISLDSVWDANGSTLGTGLAVNKYCSKIYCQLSGVNMNITTSSRQLINSGALVTKQGYPSFINIGAISTETFSELTHGNSFTIFLVVSNDNESDAGATITTSNTSSARFTMFCDRRTQKRHTVVNTGTVATADLTARLNDGNLRILGTTRNGTTGVTKAYLNGTLQNTITKTGTYTNDIFRLGADNNGNSPLVGYVSAIIVCDSELDATAVGEVTTKLETKLGL